MLIIRLQRTGKKNQADFRIVLTEKEAPVQKKFLEVLGSYNPRKKYFQVKQERLTYWLGQRVALSETLHNLLVTQKLLDKPKVKAFNIPKKPSSAEATEGKPVEAAKAETPAAETKTSETPAAEAEPSTESPATPAEQPAPAPAESVPAEVAPTQEPV